MSGRRRCADADGDCIDDLTGLLDNYVRYEVTEAEWTLRATTPVEVDAHYESSRPAPGSSAAPRPAAANMPGQKTGRRLPVSGGRLRLPRCRFPGRTDRLNRVGLGQHLQRIKRQPGANGPIPGLRVEHLSPERPDAGQQSGRHVRAHIHRNGFGRGDGGTRDDPGFGVPSD